MKLYKLVEALEMNYKNLNESTSLNYDELYQRIIDSDMASEETVECVTDLMGANVNVLNKIIEWATGCESWDDFVAQFNEDEDFDESLSHK